MGQPQPVDTLGAVASDESAHARGSTFTTETHHLTGS